MPGFAELTESPDDLQTDNAPYCPTPEEIRAMCLVIQSEWTEAEERSRRVIGNPSPEVRPVKSAAIDD